MPERRMPDYSYVKEIASGLLRKYKISEPPVDPVEISRAEGIPVKFAKLGHGFEEASGFFYPKENAIYVNSEEFPLRQTFTIAHELAHAMLHREWAASESYTILYRDQNRNDRRDPHEKEANSFAANLLVPRFMLDKYYLDLSVSDLSRLFAVSVPTIQNRLAFEYGF